jgi:tetratricopeptide (TPR) repeat protein
MIEMTIADTVKLLMPIAKLVWPHARRIYKEHQAGLLPSTKHSDLLDQGFQETLDRIVGSNVDSVWWENLLNKIEQPLVAPDFLLIHAIQDWLSDVIVQNHLKTIAKDRIMGVQTKNNKSLSILRSKYAEKTGEKNRFADDPIEIVVAIIAAGFLASINKASQPLAAMIQESAIESRAGFEGLHERFDQIGPDYIVVRAHNADLIKSLTLIIKRRALDHSFVAQEIQNLVHRVMSGDLCHADIVKKEDVLYWATRINASDIKTLDNAKKYREQLLNLNPKADTHILDALVLETEGDCESALRILRDIDDSDARAVLFIILRRQQSAKVALEWFENQAAHEDPHFFTGVGWSNVAIILAENGRWEEAAQYLLNSRIHIDDWPDLAYIEGIINVALMLPTEHRIRTLSMDVFSPLICTLEGAQIDILRKQADERFAIAEEKLREIHLEERARGAGMWRLWLRLTNRHSQDEQAARLEVQEGMKNEKLTLDYLPFALTFKIPFDTEPIRKFLEQRKRLGGLNKAETFAEFQLAELTLSPIEFVSFLEKEEDRITKVLTDTAVKAIIAGKQVESLVKDGQTARARHLLEERKNEFAGKDYERLEALISTFEGNDPRANLEELYKQTNDLIDLQNLINCVGRAGDWQALLPLLEKLFYSERTAKNAHQLIDCIRRMPSIDEDKIIEFLEKNEDLLPQHPELTCEMAWTLFNLGRWQESKIINDDLLENRHSNVDIILDINLAILLGDTERFATIVNREYPNRDKLEPRLLMMLATIAAEIDVEERRAFEFASIAASKSLNDPNILVNAYALAVQIGRENDEKVSEWMTRAIEQSDEHGPIQKINMRKMIEEMLPAQRERSQRIEEAIVHGEIPIHMAADVLNIPLSRIILDTPVNNEKLADNRKLIVIPIISGARLPVEIRPEWSIGFDATSLMLLWSLDLLSLTLDSFPRVVLASNTMPLLLNERRNVRFHQPSRVKRAETIQSLNLKTIELQDEPPKWLIEEVGIVLAQLLQRAKIAKGYVIHPLPIYALNVYMEREAELREYKELIVSTQAFASMLFVNGYITEKQRDKSLLYLRLHDRDKNESIVISCLDVPLFLSDLAVSYIQSAGLLEILCSAGINIQVHPKTLSDQDNLIKAAREGRDLADSLNHIRTILKQALENGKAIFLQKSHAISDEIKHGKSAYAINTFEHFFEETTPCDAISIDDRFLNRHPKITDRNGRIVTIICVLDLLRHFQKCGVISEEEKNEKLHKLRKSGFALVPIEPSELENLIRKAGFNKDMQLKETVELRTLRQTMMRIRSLDMIQQPIETALLDRSRICCLVVILRLWKDESLAVERIIALTDWLWRNISPSPLDWVRTARGKVGMLPEAEAYALHIELLLKFMPSLQNERLDAFRSWVDRTILEPLLPANANLVDAIALRVRANIEELSQEYGKNV